MKKEKELKSRSKYTSKYFKKFQGRSQTTYEELVQEDYDRILKRAHELSSLKETDYSSLIILTIPDAFDRQSKVTYRLDVKPDNTHTLLYDQALMTLVFFGEKTLHYYRANVDHRNGHIANDICGEFSYFDVIHTQTSLVYDNPNHPKYITLDMNVGLCDGSMIPFHLRNHRLHDDYDLKVMLTPEEKKFIDLLKEKVRMSHQL